MSYLVLARKWRPTTFDEVIGQHHVTQTLKNAIESHRVAHALLFTGSRGIGKTSCARILAKALNCENGPTVSPCGDCSACVDIANGASVDVFEIDGASNNSVEQIREIRESVKFVPSQGRRKIYIIDEVHMLSTSAFNALLKTLEEPPDHVLFIFATTEPQKIPDTIHSRCQRYDFKRIPERTIVDALKRIAESEDLTIDESALFHVAREARGGMRDSLSLLDQVIAYCGLTIREAEAREVLGIAERSVFSELVDALLNGDGQTALRLVDEQYRRGLDLQKFAGEFVRHLRDLMVVRVCAEPQNLLDVPPDELSSMIDRVRDLEPSRLHRIFNSILSGVDEVNRSSFPKLVFEMTLLWVCHQWPTLPLAGVLEGLDRLERRLRSADGGVVAADVPARGEDAGEPVPETAPDHAEAEHQPPRAVGPRQAQPTPRRVNPDFMPDADDLGGTVSPTESESPSPSVDEAQATSPNHVAEEPTTPQGDASQPSAATPAPPVASTPAGDGPVDERSASDGFKRRPQGEQEYDDLSGAPPAPRPVESLRPLAVKPRLKIALPAEDIEPFLEVSKPKDEEAPTADTDDHVDGGDDELDESSATVSASPPSESSPTLPVDEMPLNLDDGRPTIEHFSDLLSRVRDVDPFLASELQQTLHLVSFGERRLVVAIPGDRYDGLEAGLDTFCDVVSRAIRPVPEVCVERCVPGDERLSGETLFARKKRLEQEVREARRRSARHDQVVQRATEALNAEIVDVQLTTTD